jgi:hypothetical protein
MEKGNWEQIQIKLHDDLKMIFKDYDVKNLKDYEKRRIVFEYLSNNVTYDFELLEAIRDFHVSQKSVSRDSYLELENVIYEKKGICNGISQYYKLLLGELGIKSFCVICDDGTPVKHQLTLVYDEDKDTYSFDDVVSVIVGRGTLDDFFDYDLPTANVFNQGNKKISGDKYWFILPDSFIDFLIGRNGADHINLEQLPDNISSVKDGSSFKF